MKVSIKTNQLMVGCVFEGSSDSDSTQYLCLKDSSLTNGTIRILNDQGKVTTMTLSDHHVFLKHSKSFSIDTLSLKQALSEFDDRLIYKNIPIRYLPELANTYNYLWNQHNIACARISEFFNLKSISDIKEGQIVIFDNSVGFVTDTDYMNENENLYVFAINTNDQSFEVIPYSDIENNKPIIYTVVDHNHQSTLTNFTKEIYRIKYGDNRYLPNQWEEFVDEYELYDESDEDGTNDDPDLLDEFSNSTDDDEMDEREREHQEMLLKADMEHPGEMACDKAEADRIASNPFKKLDKNDLFL